MNDDPGKAKLDLEKLVNRHRDTGAPPGFSNRVIARIDERSRHPFWQLPRFAFATASVVVATVSFFVINSVVEEKLDQQIATQKPQQVIASSETSGNAPAVTLPEGPIIQPENRKPVAVAQTNISPVKASTTVKLSQLEQELFFQAWDEADSTSLTALSEVSNWIAEQKDIAIPDISDMPDLGDIDSLFDTT